MTNSLFDETTPETIPPVVTTQQAPSNNAEDLVNQLVGEGKKFKTIQDLAKAKLESDSFIERITQENKELREGTVSKADIDAKFDAFLTKLNEQKKAPDSREQTVPALDADKIADIVRNTITRTEQESTAAKNVQAANEKVIAKYGDKAGEFIEKKAAELGMTKQDLKTISAKSPNAFFTIVGLDLKAAAPAGSGFNQGSVNTESKFNNSNISADTWEYYSNLRRQAPDKYWEPAIQNEIFEKVKTGKLPVRT